MDRTDADRLEARLEKLDDKLASMERSLASIDKTLTLNTEHLAEHIRRTNKLEKELVPVVKHVEQMRGAAKLISMLALIATVLTLFFI